MDEAIGIIFITFTGILLGFGVAFLVGDYRHFDTIEKQCIELGYIQNNSKRILCQIESKK